MNKPFAIKDPVYGSEVWVMLGGIGKVEGLLRILAPKYVSDGCDNWEGCTWPLGKEDGAARNRTFIVALKKFDKDAPEDIGTLSHELMHVVCGTLRDVGMKLNSGSEEAYTYLHEWLLVETLNRLNQE